MFSLFFIQFSGNFFTYDARVGTRQVSQEKSQWAGFSKRKKCESTPLWALLCFLRSPLAFLCFKGVLWIHWEKPR